VPGVQSLTDTSDVFDMIVLSVHGHLQILRKTHSRDGKNFSNYTDIFSAIYRK
jgi:hypothetical protein